MCLVCRPGAALPSASVRPNAYMRARPANRTRKVVRKGIRLKCREQGRGSKVGQEVRKRCSGEGSAKDLSEVAAQSVFDPTDLIAPADWGGGQLVWDPGEKGF